MEEANARAALAAMQAQLARGPQAVLGITPTASAGDIRRSFLALTKQYHPTRFARMSPEIQRLANEVFLGIKAAHDTLKPSATRSSVIPIARPKTNTSPGLPTALPRPTSMGMPPLRAPNAPPPVPGQATRPMPTIAGGVPRPIDKRSETTRPMAVVPPAAPGARTTNPLGSPVVRAPADPGAKTPPLELRPQPKITRPGTGPVPNPTTSAAVTDKNFPRIDTQPGVAARPLRNDRLEHRLDPSTTHPPAPSVKVALELLEKRQWDAAKVALAALSAMAPESQHVRALVCFASGRQAQIEHRFDEARVDLQRALQLDPDLQPAKAALSELFQRRK